MMQGEDLLHDIYREMRALSANAEELLTVEQVAVRLSLTAEQVRRRMKKGLLPRGRVWFDRPGLGPYFSWRALCEFVCEEPDSQVLEEAEIEAIPQRRRKGRSYGSQT